MTIHTERPTTISRAWHPQAPDGCRSCGSAERQHFARGLCEQCYREIRADGTLDEYQPVSATNGWETSSRNGVVYRNHQRRKDIAWERQRRIADAAWRDGKPWLTGAAPTLLPIPRQPRARPRLTTPVAAAPPPPVSMPVAPPPVQFTTVEERRAAQLRWAEQDKQQRAAVRRTSA